MELLIKRQYDNAGTNGTLFINGVEVCHTIELPWKDNKNQVSCIPEGSYGLQKRYSEKHGNHLLVTGTKERKCILIHPANDAMKELMGCIAPVTTLTGPGKGMRSRIACSYVTKMVFEAIDNNENIVLKISK